MNSSTIQFAPYNTDILVSNGVTPLLAHWSSSCSVLTHGIKMLNLMCDLSVIVIDLLQSIIPLVTSEEQLICLTWNHRKCIYWMLDQLCDFKPLPQPWLWSWIFKVNFEIAVFQEWNQDHLRWNEKNWVSRMLDPLCDVELWPWPWLSKKLYLRYGRTDWHGMKGMLVDSMLDLFLYARFFNVFWDINLKLGICI